MSQVYNLEPPTKGQIMLHTTHGDIEIELWPKEAPKVRLLAPVILALDQ
jgi:peptidyl-prolyl cis-trans isomerase SDCCAG10